MCGCEGNPSLKHRNQDLRIKTNLTFLACKHGHHRFTDKSTDYKTQDRMQRGMLVVHISTFQGCIIAVKNSQNLRLLKTRNLQKLNIFDSIPFNHRQLF